MHSFPTRRYLHGVFIKQNPIPHSRSLECEKDGLAELKIAQSRHGLNIPQVISWTLEELTLEKVEGTDPTRADWIRLGEGLAEMHRVTRKKFGFHSNNFIGLNPQKNSAGDNWGRFFYENRLLFQADLIVDLDWKWLVKLRLQAAERELIDFLNAHKPQASLLHGDLWSGNVMFSENGPWLVDPAVYYGDRETDIAMTKMFGGFDPIFYSTYQQSFPLPAGSDIRERIYNLYHYLNHYNLFGSSYWPGIEKGLTTIEALT